MMINDDLSKITLTAEDWLFMLDGAEPQHVSGLCECSCPFFCEIDLNNLIAVCAKDRKPINYYDGFCAHCIE